MILWTVADEKKLMEFYKTRVDDYTAITANGTKRFCCKQFCEDFIATLGSSVSFHFIKKKVENIHSGKYEFNV